MSVLLDEKDLQKLIVIGDRILIKPKMPQSKTKSGLYLPPGVNENEKVQIVNINNGERLETYVIKGERGSGQVCLNGPAARKCVVGDVVIIMAYALMDFEEAKTFKPAIVFPDTETNRLV